MEGIRAIDWYRRKVKFLKLSMNFHTEKAKSKQTSKELPDETEEESLDVHMKAIRLCWHELENIFQQLIGSIIVVKRNSKKGERRPGLTTIILIALKKFQNRTTTTLIEREDESNIVTLAFDFVALWIDLVDAFIQINPWQSRHQSFSNMNTLNFSKKPWKIVNKVIQIANDKN
jgi:predicted nucleotide-binding protein (sugar kinase/HSP70/actin superfamily)